MQPIKKSRGNLGVSMFEFESNILFYLSFICTFEQQIFISHEASSCLFWGIICLEGVVHSPSCYCYLLLFSREYNRYFEES